MPKKYKSKSTKPYKRYDPEILEAAITAYKIGKKSFAEIAKEFNISKSVLYRHTTRIMKTQGGQNSLNEDAEKYIINYINICSEWGYPLDTYDLRVIIKGYLDRVGLEIKKFNNNLPGTSYIDGFLRRHNKDISERVSQNIKRSSDALTLEVVVDYFGELEKSLEGVELCNIVNYDETSLSDDPGKKRVLVKRCAKYPERIMTHTKSSTSIMMAASADGTLLPCYVVYRATHLYTTWITNGPTNCRYNRTNSGWFDGNTFEDWVETVVLPYFNNKTGKKILIGDYLSSHLSLDLIRKCQEHNIHFVFLPPNSTHLTQPLDIAFFRPVNIVWRDILFTWRKSEFTTLPTIPKNVFPKLLKLMLERLEPNVTQNIISGFIKAGISPFNKVKVLSRLPENNTRNEFSIEEKEAIDHSVFILLKEMRFGAQNIKITHDLKINVKPGKSVENSVCLDSDVSSSSVIDKANETRKNKISETSNSDIQTAKIHKGKGIGKKSKKEEETSILIEGQCSKTNEDINLQVIMEDNFVVRNIWIKIK